MKKDHIKTLEEDLKKIDEALELFLSLDGTSKESSTLSSLTYGLLRAGEILITGIKK